jgi:uncharacterized protein
MSEPREVFARLKKYFVSHDLDAAADVWAQDVVIETPFAPAGAPRRIDGREQLLTIARAGRATLPMRVDEVRDIAIHDTADPEVIVVEYEITATVTTTNRTASAPFIAVLHARDGRIVHWREYQNTAAMAEVAGAAR